MMCVPISRQSLIYRYNVSIIHNTKCPEYRLKKKSNSICYHGIRGSVAIGDSLIAHITMYRNVTVMLTKVLCVLKRRNLMSEVLYDI